MTSPSATPVTTATSRRRQRSTRLVVASLLVVLAALLVAGSAVTGSWLVVTLAGVVCVLLAAAAVRITWTEVLESRLLAGRDRSDQARAYLALTETRTAEQAIYVADTRGRLTRHEATIARLETRLAQAATEVVEAHRLLEAERETARTAIAERDRVTARLDEAEDRAAHAVVRVVELEQELDVVLSEWRSGVRAPQRKHA